MSDFIYIIIVSTVLWFHQVATAYEFETKAEINDLQNTASLLWMEGSLVGDKLNECKKQIRRKR